ncbi:MAG: hypothetical protein P8080_13465, partial [Gammaproteobacteria bacterium]
AMLGAVPIIIDPIFSGLAWSLIFGLFASTLFTLFVIPVVYWLLYANKPGHGLPDAFVAPGTPAAGDVVAVRVKLTAHGPDRLTAFRTVRLQERAPW